MDWPPRRTGRRSKKSRRLPERKWIAFMTGLMVWTVYCAFVASFPEYRPDSMLGDPAGLALTGAVVSLAVWMMLVLPYIRFVEPR